MIKEKKLAGIKGWLLVYLICSIPVILFCSASLSGWFLDYPIWLFIIIFLVFTIPLGLILIKFSQAPKWNIILVWTIAVLINVRIISGLLMSDMTFDLEVSEMVLLTSFTLFPYVWAILWTQYYKKSVRVKNTFVK